MKLADSLLPLLMAALLLLFFSGLPDLRRCPLPSRREGAALLPRHPPGPEVRALRRRLAAKDWLIAGLLTLCCALASFWGLGDRTAPQSFQPLAGEEAVLRLARAPSSLLLYSGVGNGGYVFEQSADGADWQPLTDFEQDHVAVLKWHTLELSDAAIAAEGPVYVRVRGSYGEPWLGELVFRDESGAAIEAESEYAALCDEPETAPAAYSYLNSTYFDEIYHARTAWEHLHGLWPYEISHPPLGKEILSVGIVLFGMTPFGWRFMGTLFGAAMLPLLYVFLKKLFGGRAVPALGTLLWATDFMRLTQTRIATIDTYSVFFILLMYLFLWIWLTEDRLWALALCGLSFGLGAASKWTSIYAGAGLAVLWAAHWLRRFRDAKKARSAEKVFPAFCKNALFCLLFFVALPCLIYYLSYLPYGRAQNLGLFTREYTAMVLHNQDYMFSYHSNIVAEHPYSSRWYQWLLNIRPILYYLEYFPDGTRSEIAAFLNPTLCWGGLLSLFVLLYAALFRRDGTAAFILVGYLSQLLPWVFISRLTFAYHYFPSALFLVLSLGYVFSLMRRGSRRWYVYAGGFAAVSLLLFVLFYPALTGLPVNGDFAKAALQWLPTWPLVRILP